VTKSGWFSLQPTFPFRYITDLYQFFRDRVQKSEKVTSGELDMDDLCAQLKSKARCSGKGAVIDEADVDAILGPVFTGQKDFFSMFS